MKRPMVQCHIKNLALALLALAAAGCAMPIGEDYRALASGGAAVVTEYDLEMYLDIPMIGMPPDTGYSGLGVRMQTEWTDWEGNPVSGTFSQEKAYKAALTFNAADGYTFDPGSQFKYSGGYSSKVYGYEYDPDSNINRHRVIVTFAPFMPQITGISTFVSVMEKLLEYKGNPGLFVSFSSSVNEGVSGGADKALLDRGSAPPTVIIEGSHSTLTVSAQRPLLTVGPGMTVTLRNLTINGNDSNQHPLIDVEAGGTLNLEGVIITGNTNRNNDAYFEQPGGIRIRGTVFMEGGEISGNTGNVGGAAVADGGQFTLSGGNIAGNKSAGDNIIQNAAGVLVKGGTFTMDGGAVIQGSGSSGGGSDRTAAVVLENSGIFEMKGGIIRDNSRYGVMSTDGFFRMWGKAQVIPDLTSGTNRVYGDIRIGNDLDPQIPVTDTKGTNDDTDDDEVFLVAADIQQIFLDADAIANKLYGTPLIIQGNRLKFLLEGKYGKSKPDGSFNKN